MGIWGKLISMRSNLLWKYLMKKVVGKLYRIHKSKFFQFLSMKTCILLCYLDIIVFIIEHYLVFNNLLIVFIFIFYEILGVTILTRRFDDVVARVPIKMGNIHCSSAFHVHLHPQHQLLHCDNLLQSLIPI